MKSNPLGLRTRIESALHPNSDRFLDMRLTVRDGTATRGRLRRNRSGKTLAVLLPVFIILFSCSLFTEPENKAKEGFTAKEAEQIASERAIAILSSPVLVGIESPESGGGVNRKGRLAKGEKGKWLFGYFVPGSTQGLLVEVMGTRAYPFATTIDNLLGLQEILPNYIDSSVAVQKAEENGGKDIRNVNLILCQLSGEPVWPPLNPTKVAWQITYRLSSGTSVVFFIEAYTGLYLGKKG